MRAEINMLNVSGNRLPFDYQYALASVFMSKMNCANPMLAKKLHDAKGFKHYCFSWLLPGKIIPKPPEGLTVNTARIVFSSPDQEFVRTFAEGFLSEPEFRLIRTQFNVERIEVLPETVLSSPQWFRTLSPIYTKTRREIEGKLVDWDLYPMEGKFYENVHLNLTQRFKDYFGYPPTSDHFEITEIEAKKMPNVKIDGSPRRCTHMRFKVSASPELLKFMHDAGLGEKQGMGFGCVEAINEASRETFKSQKNIASHTREGGDENGTKIPRGRQS